MTAAQSPWSGYHVNLLRRPDDWTAPANRIVVALDGSAYAERSLEAGDALAAAANLPLALVAVRPATADLVSTEAYLARIARRAPRVDDVIVEVRGVAADPLVELVDDGALVVLATHARRPLGEVVFGSVADQVLRRTDRPVLLVGPEAGVPDPDFSSLVVPDDAGVGARGLRPDALAWSGHLGAVARVVQVSPASTTVVDTDVLEVAHVQRVAAEFGEGASDWEVLHGGDPAERIVEFAREHRAGMIAMTVPARHRVGPDIAGGVALQVVRHAPCPVLAKNRTGR